MNSKIKGVVWKCGDAITAYQIVPQQYWAMSKPKPDGETMAQHLFEGLPSADAPHSAFVQGNAQIIVAGKDFGCGGKSIPHPVIALASASVALVIAESVSRYCYRNMVNLALPVLICPGIGAFASSGQRLEADILTGKITREDGESCLAEPISELAMKMLEAGGALRYYCK